MLDSPTPWCADGDARPRCLPALPNGVYRVIYADPPWQYGDNRQGDGYARQDTGAAYHHATMTLDELMALKVRDIAAPDSVLLMWATFPMLREALQLIDAWGFAYKQAFVCDKGHGSLGHYHDCDAELLTISARGTCLPDSGKRPKQIQRFAREGHSRKPSAWRDLIDAHWQLGPRVELFYRGKPIEGWKTWVAEAPAQSAPQRSGEGARNEGKENPGTPKVPVHAPEFNDDLPWPEDEDEKVS